MSEKTPLAAKARPAQLPDRVLGVACRKTPRNEYQLVTIRRQKGEVVEELGRTTEHRFIAAEWLGALLLEVEL